MIDLILFQEKRLLLLFYFIFVLLMFVVLLIGGVLAYVFRAQVISNWMPRCLKITEKVSFNIASEASYVYILSGQKLILKCQKLSIWASFWKPEGCGQTVLPDRSVLIGQKLVENAKIKKIKCDILGDFQTLCLNESKSQFVWRHFPIWFEVCPVSSCPLWLSSVCNTFDVLFYRCQPGSWEGQWSIPHCSWWLLWPHNLTFLFDPQVEKVLTTSSHQNDNFWLAS